MLLTVLLSLLFNSSDVQSTNIDRDNNSSELVVDAIVEYSFDSIEHKISEDLIGFNMSYMFCDDDFWEDTDIKPVLKDLKTGMLRYPDGAPTTFYHWNNLNGQGYADNWDPNYNDKYDQEDVEFTNLDEYIAICRETGIKPLVGVNMSSGVKHNRVEDGIEEAKALVQYCEDNDYGVDYYFLDNEPYLKNGGGNRPMSVEEYIEQIKLYAPAIKAVNPDAKLIINWEVQLDKNLFWRLLRETHHLIDYVDAHWYWNWGNANFNEWTRQLPMNTNNQWHKSDRSYKQELELYRIKAKNQGVDNVKLISLEWNVGPSKSVNQMPSPFQCALMQSEMLMQFMDGDMEIAALWAFFWEVKDMAQRKNYTRYLFDNYKDYRVMPCYDTFLMLSDALGKQKGRSTSTAKQIIPLCVTNNDRTEDIVYILHKGMFETTIAVPGPESSEFTLEVFSADKKDTTYGSTKVEKCYYDEDAQAYYFTLPGFSMAQLTIKK